MSSRGARCALVLSRAQLGLDAPQVQVEAQVGPGLPNFHIVGLPAPVVRESRERVRAAIISSGFDYPSGRITLNLAPVELSKQGGRFDLPIALALLRASGQLPPPLDPCECYGELGLNGELKPVSGLFLAALHAAAAHHAVLVPEATATEVRLSGHGAIRVAATLREAAGRYAGASPAAVRRLPDDPAAAPELPAVPDPFAGIVGQFTARRALCVAAAGGHSVLLVGPPGTGKSMLAARLPQLLPPLGAAEAREVASICSTGGVRLDPARWLSRPFRAPHHSASVQAIIGGGAQASPGEISLAHHGVLFLDELPEFDRRVLESLREPLETGTVTIARAAARVELPARFQLVAAMNPCPCGWAGDPSDRCQCGSTRIERYLRRISGPLLDRIDIRVYMPRTPGPAWTAPVADRAGACATSAVQAARRLRLHRSGCLAARLDAGGIRACCALSPALGAMLQQLATQFMLSGRAVHRLLAVARTIADLAGCDAVQEHHLLEAARLRCVEVDAGSLSSAMSSAR